MLKCSAIALTLVLLHFPGESKHESKDPTLEPPAKPKKPGYMSCFKMADLVTGFATSPVLDRILSGKDQAMSTAPPAAKLDIVNNILNFRGNPFGDQRTRVMDREGLRVLDPEHSEDPLARYTTVKELGTGNFGSVTLVIDQVTDMFFAMKEEPAVSDVAKRTAAFSILPDSVAEHSLDQGYGMMGVHQIIVKGDRLFTITNPLLPLSEPPLLRSDGTPSKRTTNQKFSAPRPTKGNPDGREQIALLKDRKPDNLMLGFRPTLTQSAGTGVWRMCVERVKTLIDFGNGSVNNQALKRAIEKELDPSGPGVHEEVQDLLNGKTSEGGGGG